tara:strand:- start:362 stop:2191 length:1830 start_codon:yes stop_codon:yes gene_type:complete
MTSRSVEAFAQDPNWLSFGSSLTEALEVPESYGFTSSEKLMAEVARLRGVDPASLRNPLAAVAWMNANASEALHDENLRVPMTGVLLLSQISILDKELASEIAPKFFSGDVTREELKNALRRLQEKPGVRGSTAHTRSKRAAAFEDLVFDFLTSNPETLGLGDRVKLSHSPRNSEAPADFVLTRDGETIAAIEVKSFRQKRHHRYLVETLAMTALAAKTYSRAFLIVPADWGDAIDKVGELIESLGLDGVQHAVFSDAEGGRLRLCGRSAQGLLELPNTSRAPDRGSFVNMHDTQLDTTEESSVTDPVDRPGSPDPAKRRELAAANFGAMKDRIVAIEPSLVHSAGMKDRMDGGLEDIDALASSIRAVGQKIPIIIRPHPDLEGEYEIVAGRRRLEACRIAGLKVRAEIQALDDKALVLGQAIENIAREDLTYIERARLAVRMADEAGLPEAAIDEAFCCGKTDRSRYLKIGRGVPSDILTWIGKAPSVGRPRWEKLVGMLRRDPEAEPRARRQMAALAVAATDLSSDQRFAHMWQAASEPLDAEEPQAASEELVSIDGINGPVARMKRSSEGLEITLLDGSREGLLEWVEANRGSVIEQIIRMHEEKN